MKILRGSLIYHDPYIKWNVSKQQQGLFCLASTRRYTRLISIHTGVGLVKNPIARPNRDDSILMLKNLPTQFYTHVAARSVARLVFLCSMKRTRNTYTTHFCKKSSCCCKRLIQATNQCNLWYWYSCGHTFAASGLYTEKRRLFQPTLQIAIGNLLRHW